MPHKYHMAIYIAKKEVSELKKDGWTLWLLWIYYYNMPLIELAELYLINGGQVNNELNKISI